MPCQSTSSSQPRTISFEFSPIACLPVLADLVRGLVVLVVSHAGVLLEAGIYAGDGDVGKWLTC